MTKFCKDCKWFEDDGAFSVCKRQTGTHTNLVTGKTSVIRAGFCSVQRGYGGSCGEGGIYFEQKPVKENWFKQIIKRIFK